MRRGHMEPDVPKLLSGAQNGAPQEAEGKNLADSRQHGSSESIAVSLLTGGSDRPYVFGLTTSLVAQGATLDLIGSDELEFPEFGGCSAIRSLNFRGGTQSDSSFREKVLRILVYYIKLITYAASAEPRIFHILWNNKFETFDRTFLMLYYKFLGKKIALTAHNVNARKRDSTDTYLNRLTLAIQYRLADQIFVHTESMRRELIAEFGARPARVTTIPFGINNAVPDTSLSSEEARKKLGIRAGEKVMLFFGRITPYKGLEYLVSAFRELAARSPDYRLIIAGRPDRCEDYWSAILGDIGEPVQSGRIILNSGFIPDDEVEVYFKAADVLVLPYRSIYQSGVLFLGQSFGLPVVAADVGSLKDEIDEGSTGFVFEPEDAAGLAGTIDKYFASRLYRELHHRRLQIREGARARHSWDTVGQITMEVYARLLGIPNAARATMQNIDDPPPADEVRGAGDQAMSYAAERRN